MIVLPIAGTMRLFALRRRMGNAKQEREGAAF
jgi:hypothetical protein